MLDIMAMYESTLRSLLFFGDYIELRMLPASNNGRVVATQIEFSEDTLKLCLKWISRFDGKSAVNLSLNPLLSINSGKHAGDNDVEYRRYILLDIDPTTEGATTDEQKALCYDLTLQVKHYLKETGFCDPILADSANSFHLIYFVGNMPNNADSTRLIASFLMCLKRKFTTDYATIDIGTKSAGRFVKIYGTCSTKEPFRRSQIQDIPADWQSATVTQEQLEAVIAQNPNDETYSAASFTSEKPAELVEQEVKIMLYLLKQQGVTVRNEQDMDGGTKKYTLCGCPFGQSDTQAQKSCLYVFESGKMSLSCRHDTCRGYDTQSFLLNAVTKNLKNMEDK
jgi:hypothetical protein